MNYRDLFGPEHDDPALRILIEGDSFAASYRYEHDLLGLTAAEGEQHAREVEALRDGYAIAALNAWWQL